MITNKRLANQTRLAFIVTPLLLLSIIAIVTAPILNILINDASRQLTRQYAVETNLNFQRYIGPHTELVRQTARSYSVTRWMADATDPDYLEWALIHIDQFHSFNPRAVLLFASLQDEQYFVFYGHDPDVLPADRMSVNPLTNPETDRWFWDTINSVSATHHNIQEGLEPHATRFWISQRAYHQGELVGVVCVGFYLYDLMETMFRDLPPDMVVHLVDADGAIQLDSRYWGFAPLRRPEAMRHLATTDYDPQLLAKVHSLAATLPGPDCEMDMFSVGLFPLDEDIGEAMALSQCYYDFGIVLPLAGTNWLTVLVSNHQAMVINHWFIALSIIFVISLILIGVVGNVVVNRNILRPFERLFFSMNNLPQLLDPSSDTPISIDGNERQDEIGELARHIEGVLCSLQQANAEAQRVAVLEETNEAKSRFLARMSHEIRTPISAILGISEAQIKRVDLEDYTKDAIYKIYTSGNLLLGIINDILDLSRIEHGDMPIIEGKYQVASMISDTMQRHVGTAVSKGLSFSVAVSPELPAYLVGDLLRIQQVMNNILSNAFKYTLTGEVSVSFGLAEPVIGGQTNLRVIVTDTGIGMSPEQVDAIFDEYSRFSEKEYRNIDGTGLGMFIVHQLLGLMGGQVEITSEKDKGTTVSFTLPQQNISDEILGATAAKNLQQFNDNIYQTITVPMFTVEPLPKGRVLVVDDLDVNLYVAEELLAMYQLDVLDTAKSGQEAIARIEQGHTYDVIFMDHMMPELDGIETLHILRKQGYCKPIVALTANAMVGSEEQFLAQGFDDFLSKPVQTKRLHEVLNKFITTARGATPVAPTPVLTQADKNRRLRNKIIADFQKNHAQAVQRIEQAIAQHDHKRMLLLTHSLKGVAGLLGESELIQLSTTMESAMREGTLPDSDQLASLQHLMEISLGRLAAELAVNAEFVKQSVTVAEQLQPLLERLAPLVASNSTQALTLIDSLRAYPQTEALCQALDEFEFDTALKELHTLQDMLDIHPLETL